MSDVNSKVALPLTPSQLMALTDLVLDYLMRPGRLEVFIDVVRNIETTPEQLLAVLADRQAGSAREPRRVMAAAEPATPDLVAWIGSDELSRSGRVGLKQAVMPAGIVPLVGVIDDRAKFETSVVCAQLQRQADAFNRVIRLARYGFLEDLVVLEPRPQG